MLSLVGVDRYLNALAVDALSLHTDVPDGSGSNEATGGSYARKPIVFPVASGGIRAWSGSITFDVPAGTVKFFGLWQGADFVGYAALASDGEYDVSRIETNGNVRSADFTPTVNTQVTFLGTVPAGITAGALYYVVSIGTDVGGGWFKVSTTKNGAAVTIASTFVGVDCQVTKYYPQAFSKAGKLTLTSARLAIRTGVIATTPPPTGYRWLETFGNTISLTADAATYDLSQQISDPVATTSYTFETGDDLLATANGITLDSNTGDLTWDGATNAGGSVDLRIYASNDQPVVTGPEFLTPNWTDSQLRPDDSFASGFTASQWAQGPFYVAWNTAGGDLDTSDATAYGGTVNGRWATATLTPAAVGTTYTFDITNLLKAIARTNSGELPNKFRNFGFYVKAPYNNPDSIPPTNGSGSIKFASRVNPTVSYRPKVVITGAAAGTIYATSAGAILMDPLAGDKPAGYGDANSGPGIEYIGMTAGGTGSRNLILWFDLASLTNPANITTAQLVLTGYPEPVSVSQFAADGTITCTGHVFAANSSIRFSGPVPAGISTGTTYFVAQTFPDSLVAGTSFKIATTSGTAAYATTAFAADGTITATGHKFSAAGGAQIKFSGGPLPAGITAGTTYFTRNVVASTSFQVSATATGNIITFSPVTNSSAIAFTGAGPVTPLTFPALSTSTTQAYRFRSITATAELFRVQFPLFNESILNKSPNQTGIAWEVPDDNGLGNHPDVYFFDRCYDQDWFNRGANVVNGKKVRTLPGGTQVVDRTKGWASRSFYSDTPDPTWNGPTPAGDPNKAAYDGVLIENNDTERGFNARWPGHRYVAGRWFGFTDEVFPTKPYNSTPTQLIKGYLLVGGIDASGVITSVDVNGNPLAHQLKLKPATALPGAAASDTGDWGVPVSLIGPNWPAPFKFEPNLSVAGSYWNKRCYYIDPINATQFVLRERLFGPIITPVGGARSLAPCRVYISDGVDGAGALKGNPEFNTPYPTMRDELYVRGYFGNNPGFIQDMQACKQLIGIDSRYDSCEVNQNKVMGEANSGAVVNGYKGFSFRLHSEHPSGFINMRQWASLTDSPNYAGAMHHLYQEGYDQWTAYAYVVDARYKTGYDIFLDTNNDVAFKLANQANPSVYPAPNTGFGLSGAPSALNHGYLGWLKRGELYCVEQYVKANGLVPNPLYDPKHADWAGNNLGPAFAKYPFTMMSPLDLPAAPLGQPGSGNWSNGAPCMTGGVTSTATSFPSANGLKWISDGGKWNTSTNSWQSLTAGKLGPFQSVNSGYFNLYNAFYLRDFRDAILARTPFMPDRNNMGVYKVWIEGQLAFNYTGWWGRTVPVCADGITPYGIDQAWLCAQSGGVNRMSGDHGIAYGAMSNLCIAKKYIGPRRNP